MITTLCAAPGDFSVGLFPQESEISEHMEELQFSDSIASDPKSYLGLVSLLGGPAEWWLVAWICGSLC